MQWLVELARPAIGGAEDAAGGGVGDVEVVKEVIIKETAPDGLEEVVVEEEEAAHEDRGCPH